MKNIKSLFYKILFVFAIAQVVGCSQSSNDSAALSSGAGVAGSYARFIIEGNFLYIVDNTSIQTFNVEDEANPVRIAQSEIGSRIESIFHYDGNLFIGAGSGLYLYDIKADGIPELIADVPHNFPMPPCDPVVANATHAYVTLNTSTWRCTWCWSPENFNVLKIFDINNIQDPILINEVLMENPKGVGLDGNYLFLCDDTAGLKVLDVSNPNEVTELHHFEGFTAYDVIPLNGLLIVVGPENVYQYDYTDMNNMVLISTIPIQV